MLISSTLIQNGFLISTTRPSAVTKRPAPPTDLKAVAGEPWIDIHEKYRLPPETRQALVLAEGFKPVRVLWMPWFSSKGADLAADYDLKRLAPSALAMRHGD